MHAGELSLDGFSQPFHDQYNIGAIHLWCPHGGGGGFKLRWTHVDRGRKGSSPMWASTQKIKII